jgi:anti-sigma regulatory factor (Ser/Thr protein kinase)
LNSSLPTIEAPHEGYHHAALMYAGRDQFVPQMVPFLRAGIAAREPTLVVVGSEKIDLLRTALNGDAGHVAFADMNDVGSNPARIIPAWQDFIDAHPGRRLRGIGEPIFPERSPAELIECQHHERLLNLALEESELTLVCPYDTVALDPDVIEEAYHSHPVVSDRGGERTSHSYARENVDALLAGDLPEPRVPPHVVQFTSDSFRAIRELVARQADQEGLSRSRSDDLVLAVQEVVTNSVRHGGGSGTLRLWTDRAEIICEVSDDGRINDPLADRRLPADDRSGGWGLWLANQLCDLVQLRTGPAGSVARLHMRLG